MLWLRRCEGVGEREQFIDVQLVGLGLQSRVDTRREIDLTFGVERRRLRSAPRSGGASDGCRRGMTPPRRALPCRG